MRLWRPSSRRRRRPIRLAAARRLVATLKDLAQIAQLRRRQHIRRILQHLDVGQIDLKVLRRRLRTERLGGDVAQLQQLHGTRALRLPMVAADAARTAAASEHRQCGWFVVLEDVAERARFEVGRGTVVVLRLVRMVRRLVVQLVVVAVMEILRAEEATLVCRRGGGVVRGRVQVGFGGAAVQWTRLVLLRVLLVLLVLVVVVRRRRIRGETALGRGALQQIAIGHAEAGGATLDGERQAGVRVAPLEQSFARGLRQQRLLLLLLLVVQQRLVAGVLRLVVQNVQRTVAVEAIQAVDGADRLVDVERQTGVGAATLQQVLFVLARRRRGGGRIEIVAGGGEAGWWDGGGAGDGGWWMRLAMGVQSECETLIGAAALQNAAGVVLGRLVGGSRGRGAFGGVWEDKRNAGGGGGVLVEFGDGHYLGQRLEIVGRCAEHVIERRRGGAGRRGAGAAEATRRHRGEIAASPLLGCRRFGRGRRGRGRRRPGGRRRRTRRAIKRVFRLSARTAVAFVLVRVHLGGAALCVVAWRRVFRNDQ